MLGRKLAGRYAVVKPLAEGGFGETFLAKDIHLPDSPQCVVKKLKTGSQDPSLLHTVRRLFDSEAKVLHQLGDHGQIPRLLAHFEDGDEFYLAEEYIEGDSLADELMPGKQLDEDTVIQLVHDILEVLSFVHEQQVIHRDIKPSNLIRRKGDCKLVLIDFGAVKQVTTKLANSPTQMSRTVLIGTSGYMPSEQFRGMPRLCSDVYAVGIIAVQALTGLKPALGELPEDEETGEIAWRDRVSVSPAFATLLEKMVFYDYRQRYHSASDTLLAIQSLMAARESEHLSSSPCNTIGNQPETAINLGDSNAAALFQPFPVSPNTLQQGHTTQPVATTAQQTSSNPNSPPTTPQSPQTYSQLTTTAQQGVAKEPLPAAAGNSEQASGTRHSHTLVASPQSSPHKIIGFSRAQALTAGIITLLAGGTALAFTSPHIQSVCTVFNNCSQDLQFQSTYEQAVNDAKAAQSDYQQVKTITDIQKAQNRLDEAVVELNKIPRNIKIYPQAKEALKTYQNTSKAMTARIQQETKADETFKKANTIAQAVQKKTKSSDSVSTLDEHEAEWEKALKLLQDIPKESLVTSQVDAKRQDFDKQLKNLKDQRQKKIAAAAEYQRQLEAEQAVQTAPTRSYVPPQRSTYISPPPVPKLAPAPKPARIPRPAPVPKPAPISKPAPAPVLRSDPVPKPAPPPVVPEPPSQTPLWGPDAGQPDNGGEPLW